MNTQRRNQLAPFSAITASTIAASASAPTSPSTGTPWLNTSYVYQTWTGSAWQVNVPATGMVALATTGALMTYNGTAWVQAGPSIALEAFGTLGIQVSVPATGAGAGYTLTPQASMDGGLTWIAVGVLPAGAGANSTPVTSITAPGNFEFNVPGYTHFQLVVTTQGTGTVNAALYGTTAQKFMRSVGIGDQADAAATTSATGNFSLVSLIKGLLSRFLPCTITQSVITVGTTSTQVVAANPSRKYLAWMVLGTADVTVAPGAAAAVVGAGLVYQASGAGKQGASEAFVTNVPGNAFQCIAAAAGSTLIVWEGV